jgi:hypothetical protein
MKRPSATTTSVETPSPCKDQVFQAIHNLVVNGHARLYPISDDDYCLWLATGETFTFSQHGVLRIV